MSHVEWNAEGKLLFDTGKMVTAPGSIQSLCMTEEIDRMVENLEEEEGKKGSPLSNCLN